jgi:hypothetical protein
MTEPDRVGRLWLVLAVATRYVLALADEVPFADVAVPEPAAPATAGPAVEGARRRARSPRGGGTGRPAPAREPRRRRTGTKGRLVSISRRGLAVLLSAVAHGDALPQPSWRQEAWLGIRIGIESPSHQPPTPIPKNPSY